jgi:hypothetical protein
MPVDKNMTVISLCLAAAAREATSEYTTRKVGKWSFRITGCKHQIMIGATLTNCGCFVPICAHQKKRQCSSVAIKEAKHGPVRSDTKKAYQLWFSWTRSTGAMAEGSSDLIENGVIKLMSHPQ